MIIENIFAFMQKIMLFSSYVTNTSSFPKPLTSKEEEEYLNKYLGGDMKAKEVLIRHNLRLVAHVVKKYSGSEEADDLISVGSYGLIKAINTYSVGHGTQLSTYAAKCIENEILMLIRQNKKHKQTISIEDVLSSDEEDNEISLIDVMSDEKNDMETLVGEDKTREKLEEALKKYLTSREYQIIALRYGFSGNGALTQREVAVKLGISRSYISRIEKKAIETLQNKLEYKDFM